MVTLLNNSGIHPTEKQLKEYLHAWWYNPRSDTRSFRLTDHGVEAFERHKIASYEVDIPDHVVFTSKLVLRICNYVACPFYLQRKKIIVFDENFAVQLYMFSGDVGKYCNSRAASEEGG